MKMKTCLRALCVLGAFTHGSAALALEEIDANAPVVKLRDPANGGCTEAGVGLNNCFTNVNTMLDWVWESRLPNPAAPLLIEIGPGTFGALTCPLGGKNVTFRGSGRGITIFRQSFQGFGLDASGCKSLSFEHLTIESQFIAVHWMGGGSSNWTDVALVAGYSAWYDEVGGNSGSACALGKQGVHNFFSSTLKVKTSTTTTPGGVLFLNGCGKNWLWGSELVGDLSTNNYNGGSFRAIDSRGAGNEVHVYGSNLRVTSGTQGSVGSLAAIWASDSGEVHVHGTGIDVIAAQPAQVTAIKASSHGHVHVAASAYILRTPAGGVVKRIDNEDGHVHAPYFWEHIPDTDGNPSTIDTNFSSANGVDQAVVVSGTSDEQPHVVVYSTSCAATTPSTPWFDQVDRVCRGQ